MNKTLKYSLIIFISIILLLIIIPFFIPLNNYKGIIISKVKETINRDLTINGDIKLSLLPNPAISLPEVKLSLIDKTKEPYLVSVENAKASLKLLPLFRGTIEVASVELQKPVINLEVLNNGQKNWEFSTPKNKTEINQDAPIPTASNAKTELELPILINHFKISDGKIIYRDNGNEKIFNNINLDTHVKSTKGPIDFTLALEALEQKIYIDGNIEEIGKVIPLSANINIADEKIKIEGKLDSENNSFIGLANIKGNTKTLGLPSDLQNDYELTASIIADSKNLNLKDARLNYTNIELLANANYDIEHSSLKANIIANPGNIIGDISSNLDKASIFNGNIKIAADNLKPLLNALKIKTDKLPPIINQKISLISNVVYNSQALILHNINLIAGNSNLSGDVTLKNLKQDISAIHNLKINNFESFMALLGVNNLNRIGTLQLNGEVQKTKDTLQINDKISAFNTNIAIKGDVNLASQKTNFNLNIYSPLINLEKITSGSPAPAPTSTSNPVANNTGQASANAPKSSTPWSNSPIDLSFLNTIEGQLSANIDKLTNDSLVINNFKAKLAITGGKLNITSVSANIYGGDLNANGYVSSGKDQNATIKIDLKNAYVKSLTPQSGKIKIIDGRLNFTTELNSTGNSVYTYVNNLNGQFNVNSSNGKISGFDLNRIVDAINNAKNTEGVLRLINGSFSGGTTSFSNLVATGNIERGMVRLTECHLDASPAKANAHGQINLPQYMLDVGASVTINNFPPLGVKFYGSINNPQHKLDIEALQTYLVKNVFSSVLKDLKSGEKKPENIIKDALGLRKKKEDSSNEQNNTEQPQNQQPTDPVNKLLQKGLKKLF
ncbi:AsmA family protein [Rickettsia endosymbiont of Lasioglossum villosulum]|uniref:AsmA family protein n=1 Tax=Rickettsia endosymbiont of Lasioglossum villosulum TaxID=3066269 RepID=UPI003133209B